MYICIYVYMYAILFNDVLLIYVGGEGCMDKLVGNVQQSWRYYSRVKDVEDIHIFDRRAR